MCACVHRRKYTLVLVSVYVVSTKERYKCSAATLAELGV